MTGRKSYRAAGQAPAARTDVYQTVTDRIVAELESGTVPWRAPWVSGGRPRSMATGKPYQGVNVFLCAITAAERGYTSPWWGTYEQVKSQGGNVRAGQNKANGTGATMITLWKTFTPRDAEPDPETGMLPQRAMARLFPVFNADQCDGLPAKFYPVAAELGDVDANAQRVIDDYIARPGAPSMAYDVHGQAFYNHETDGIHMPPIGEHVTAGRFYSTAFHEMTHSTGHHTRLARRADGEGRAFGSHEYGTEELCAEMGAAMLCADAGITCDDLVADSASYIASWLRTIKEDSKMVIRAASQATRAAEYIVAGHVADQVQDADASELAA